MATLTKRCRHGREAGLTRQARLKRWRRCPCSWYVDMYVDGLRTLIRVGADEHTARMELARLQHAAADGKVVRAGGPLMDDLARRWLAAEEAKPDARPNSLHSYRSRAAHITDWFDGAPIAAVTPAEVRRFTESLLESGRAAATVAGVYSALRSMLTLAQREELIDSLPLPARSPVPKANIRRPLFTIEQGHLVVETMPEPWRAAGRLIVLTGLRIGEVLALTSAHVDLRRGVVAIQANQPQGNHPTGVPKTEHGWRAIRLPAGAVTVLRERIREHPTGRLWPGDYSDALETLTAAMESHGLKVPGRAWHELRKVHGLLLRSAGVDIRDAAAQLGHGANFAQTMAYQWAPSSIDPAVVEAEFRRHADPPSE